MDTAGVPSDVENLLDNDEHIHLYMTQKKYHPAIHLDSVAITNKRVILRKPAMLHMKKSYTDYSYADILNVSIDSGLLRSTLVLNLRPDGSDLSVEDIPKEEAQLAFRIIRGGIDRSRTTYRV